MNFKATTTIYDFLLLYYTKARKNARDKIYKKILNFKVNYIWFYVNGYRLRKHKKL